jgi:hypothetical protein
MKKKELILTGVCAALALTGAVFTAVNRELFAQPDFRAAAGALSDCFLVPGVFMTGIGGISYISSRGGYDGLSYAFARFSHILMPTRENTRVPEHFYEYKQEKAKKGRAWLKHVFFTGLAALLISAVFLIVYVS